MNIALIVLSRPLSLLSSSSFSFVSLTTNCLAFTTPRPHISTNCESPPPQSPQKLEEVTNLQERVETIGEGVVYLSNIQHHGVENRDMGMREGFGDSRGCGTGIVGGVVVGGGSKHSDDFP